MVPYLSTQLEYRVQKLDGCVVERGEVRSLRLGVVGREVQEAEGGDRFPRYGALVEYKQAGRRMRGGGRKDLGR